MESEPNEALKHTERKLAAILHADVVGYSRLMGEDEEATLRTLTSHREIMSSLIVMHHGRWVSSAGDSILAEFVSTFEALECAIEFQGAIAARNAGISPERRMQFRIGINVGEVIVQGDDIFGEGVNIAARLESLAEPGGICISGSVYEQLKNKLSLAYEFLGKQDVKNIAEPVAAFRVGLGPDEIHAISGAPGKPEGVAVTPPRKWAALAVVGALLLGAGGLAVWQFDRATPTSAVDATPAQHVTATHGAGKLSIAVLPFVNMSANSVDDDFSDGITEDLITSLVQFKDLDVISSSSVFSYKGKPVKVQQVGEELGVRFVLEGSIRTSGKQIRLTAQLVEAATGHHLWAESYDRDIVDVFLLQDELTKEIVRNLAAFAVKTGDHEKMPHEGFGTVIKVENKKIVLVHEKIEGFMASMEMSYQVKSAALLDGLKPGDKIAFTINFEEMTITSIRPNDGQ
ncbi:MAG: copper-binding protein [Rhodospirillales bacterium]|nr:copper-binding protein [Rhodospirillales bacterium]